MNHSVDSEDTSRDAELQKLYREAARDEPPVALDGIILQAARREVETRVPKLRGAWRGWLGPVSLFATVVLTVTVTLLVHEERLHEEKKAMLPSEGSPRPADPGKANGSISESKQEAPPRPPAPAAIPQAPTAERSKSDRDDSASARSSADEEQASSVEKRKGDPSSAASQVPAERGLTEQPSASSRGVLPEPLQDPSRVEAAVPASPPLGSGALGDNRLTTPKLSAPATSVPRANTPEAQDQLETRRRQIPSVRSSGESGSSPDAREGPSVTAPQAGRDGESPRRTPEAWLDEIRAMRRLGREAEAQRALADFRSLYPTYPLPEDLR